jgi:hypothetical protein
VREGDTWVDRLGDRAWDMRNDLGAVLGLAVAGSLVGLLIGALVRTPNLGMAAGSGAVVGALAYTFTWIAMGAVAIVGAIVETVLGISRWLARKLAGRGKVSDKDAGS